MYHLLIVPLDISVFNTNKDTFRYFKIVYNSHHAAFKRTIFINTIIPRPIVSGSHHSKRPPRKHIHIFHLL